MRIALITNHNNYCGREYMAAFSARSIRFEVISIGSHPDLDPDEEIRCAGLWKPAPFAEAVRENDHANFPSLKDPALLGHLSGRNFDLGIQGGTGILKQAVIDSFRLGILNFHPGDLPAYRGCSAPEWQLLEGRPVVSTCHLVDKGIDTGRIYRKRELDLDYSDYHRMRAGVYPKTAAFAAEVLEGILAAGGFATEPLAQDETHAQYRNHAGEERIENLKLKLKQRRLEQC